MLTGHLRGVRLAGGTYYMMISFRSKPDFGEDSLHRIILLPEVAWLPEKETGFACSSK